ncbi:DUF192 domain-containing protein [Methanobrevibacter sp. OttesenSCG-928-K11]|nr:DUF192 domain-containing protein [Methanobrevibacter sp. OttesenSCG-928-K11]MDL2270697.1 DUF192 domain-containing protein [Methanobrevibacter sp. OttesenSCG-928-I08]
MKTKNKTLIYNKTKSKIIETPIKFANSYFSRLKGLMFKSNINYALVFNMEHSKNKHTSSIHTFFMFMDIDIYFIDNKMKVFEIARLSPWKVYVPSKKAKYILEFKKDSVKNLSLNDEIDFVCENS